MKSLNLNTLQRPTWELTLRDTEETKVHLLTPEVDLVDRLVAMAPELQEVAKSKDGKTIAAVYGLIAELMNCNEEGFIFTAEELRDRYKIRLIDLFQITAGYMEFLKEIQSAKN